MDERKSLTVRVLINSEYYLELGTGIQMFTYILKNSNINCMVKSPEVEIDGKQEQLVIREWQAVGETVSAKTGVAEYVFKGLCESEKIFLLMYFRVSLESTMIRFRFEFYSDSACALTKAATKDNLVYFSLPLLGDCIVNEIRISEFNEKIHATHKTEQEIDKEWFDNNLSVMGPLITFTDNNFTSLLAYEHGSQYPDRFLEFQLKSDKTIKLAAVKGNYYHGQLVTNSQPFSSPWFQMGAVKGSVNDMAAEYRNFVLKQMSENTESRKPYLFYNTWGRQERVKWRGEKYLTTMNLEYTLNEIERAHQLGLEVYVIDTGWYEKTGDWKVNSVLFPDALKKVKQKLEGYGMKLGLWFNPITAALTSNVLQNFTDCRKTFNGKPDEPVEIWETEKSVGMCLVSRYWEAFADRLIELVDETGVTYFKWDAIGQYGCNDPGHYHGSEANVPQERADSYAFLLPVYMNKVIEKVTAVCPEAIFDFDITEDGRSVGLQFLANGKYFIMNNGPYYHNFNVCDEWKSPTPNGNPNIFVNPGAARGWYTRAVLDYDKWIPSVLFLTHYFPDAPRASQEQNMASLMLGQNGIWGEILPLCEADVQFISEQLTQYKAVRQDVTSTALIQTGCIGDSHEVYEKINLLTGKGLVAIFANHAGHYQYITKNKVSADFFFSADGITVTRLDGGKALIQVSCGAVAARMVFFK